MRTGTGRENMIVLTNISKIQQAPTYLCSDGCDFCPCSFFHALWALNNEKYWEKQGLAAGREIVDGNRNKQNKYDGF